jgi:hypothetical protein
MSGLAETHLQPTTWRQWLLRGVAVLAALALLAGLALKLKDLMSGVAGPKRQVARISILPDTPPPPPPPREEKKPEPQKEDARQPIRDEPLKPDMPKPADEPIKMEGPAGDGPSAFAAGSVNNDYKGGAPVIGAASAGGGADRAQERFYANTVRQLLHDEIEKHLRPEAGSLTATFAVWVETDGSIRRFELVPTGDAARDSDLRTALDQTSQLLRLPTHGGVAQPMRFRLSVRSAS